MKPILLIGEAKGENEAKINSSFVGASGVELLKMLHESGILTLTESDWSYISRFWDSGDPRQIDMIWNLHPEVYRTNVFQLHPPGNKLEALCGPKVGALKGWPPLIKGKHVRAEFAPELERLADEILTIDPNLIITLGNAALWALAGKTGISKLRGSTGLTTHLATGFKYLPTYHPAAVLRQWELRPTTVMDLMKASREASFPEVRRPKREIWIEPTLEDLHDFHSRFILGCKLLAVDIETSGNRVTCIGFAPSPGLALVVPFDDDRKKKRSYWPTQQLEAQVWKLVRGVLEDRAIYKVFQNGMYDIAFLWRSMGIKVLGASEDSMLCHHALQPESLKSLGFLGSIYCDEGPWKTERKHGTTIKADE